MKHRYIAFLSFIVVIMFIIMAFSGITSQQNSQNNNISTSVIKPLSYGLTVDKWSVSGKTCAPSKASMGSTVTLKIDVTSFSESKCAGPTIMYFYVNYKNVHTVDVSSTGIYTYNWNVGLNYGNINFHAEYLSESAWEDYPAHLGFKPMVFFRNAYSTFGDFTIHVKKYLDVTGYDGNNTIYLSTGSGSFYKIYNMKIVGRTNDTYTKSSDLCTSNDSTIEGITSYGDSCDGSYLQINLNLTSLSEGNYYMSPNREYSGLRDEYIDINTNAPSDIASGIQNNIQTSYNNGFNIATNTNNKGTEIDQDVCSLILDGISLIPVAGYAATAISAASTTANLISTISSANNPAGTSDNNIAGIKYCFNAEDVLFGAGTVDEIEVPHSDLNHNFTITVKYYDEYMCDGSSIPFKTASTTQTLNAVTASAIYGEILNSNGQLYQKNTTLYLKNINNNNFYKIQVKNGHYLFFAQPNTEYKVYNPNLNQICTIDASNLTAGNSFSHNIFDSEL